MRKSQRSEEEENVEDSQAKAQMFFLHAPLGSTGTSSFALETPRSKDRPLREFDRRY